MGLFDDVEDAFDDVKGIANDADLSESHLKGHGFDPSVCDSCPHQEGEKIPRCGLCGCPTTPTAPMNLMGAPPESCPKLDEHEE